MKFTLFLAFLISLSVLSPPALSAEEMVKRPSPDLDAKATVLHVFASDDGESHLEELVISSNAKPIPGTTMIANAYQPDYVDWHLAPAATFTINMSGTLQVEVSDGTKREIGPGDLVFLNDLHGKGHITRLQGPVTNVFISVPEDFDFHAWVNGNQFAP